MSDPVTAKGQKLKISFDGRMLTVVPAVAFGRKTEKRIPLTTVRSVEWQPATKMRQGQLTLVLADSERVEAKFLYKVADDWTVLRDAVEAAISS